LYVCWQSSDINDLSFTTANIHSGRPDYSGTESSLPAGNRHPAVPSSQVTDLQRRLDESEKIRATLGRIYECNEAFHWRLVDLLDEGACGVSPLHYIEEQIKALQAKLTEAERRCGEAESKLEQFASVSSERNHGASGMCCQLRLHEKARADSLQAEVERLRAENHEAHAMLTGRYEIGWCMTHPDNVPDTELGKAAMEKNLELARLREERGDMEGFASVGERDRLARCGREAVEQLRLGDDSNSPADVRARLREREWPWPIQITKGPLPAGHLIVGIDSRESGTVYAAPASEWTISGVPMTTEDCVKDEDGGPDWDVYDYGPLPAPPAKQADTRSE